MPPSLAIFLFSPFYCAVFTRELPFLTAVQPLLFFFISLITVVFADEGAAAASHFGGRYVTYQSPIDSSSISSSNRLQIPSELHCLTVVYGSGNFILSLSYPAAALTSVLNSFSYSRASSKKAVFGWTANTIKAIEGKEREREKVAVMGSCILPGRWCLLPGRESANKSITSALPMQTILSLSIHTHSLLYSQ